MSSVPLSAAEAHICAGYWRARGWLGTPQEYFEARAETGSPPHPGYFLAGLPRTGAGIRDDVRPTDAPEYSDLRVVDGWEEHLERTFRLGTTDNGVFGAKLMWNQLPDLRATRDRDAGVRRPGWVRPP